MAIRLDYTPVVTHARVSVIGLLGLLILVMWFGMVARFHGISDGWPRRTLWAFSIIGLAGLFVLAGAGAAANGTVGWILVLGGAPLLMVAFAWGGATIPVRFPRLDPLPGPSSERVRVIRERWSRR